MEKYFAIHTTESNYKDRHFLILRVTDERATVMLHDYREVKVVAEEVDPGDLENLMDKYSPLEQQIENLSILKDSGFLKEHPGIVNVAMFLGLGAETSYRQTGKYNAFDRLGVNNVEGFLNLVKESNEGAKKLYEDVRDLFNFNDLE